MIPIFLASVSAFSGKNVVCLGLASRLRREGMKVGYFKPVGIMPERRYGVLTDEDAVLFKEALELAEPLDTLCPLVLTDENFARALRGSLPDARQTILSAYEKASAGKDAMLVAGLGRLSAGLFLGYPAHQFIKETGARAIVTEKYVSPVEALDGFLHAQSVLGAQLAGIVFNRIDTAKRTQIENAVAPFLKSRGIDVLGIIPEDRVLAAVPLSELIEALNAQVLCCESARLPARSAQAGDVLIENFLVGAMNVNAALTYFRRTPNKAVITGGDRADIQLAALESNAQCLILTGDLYPNERILTQAESQSVPVLLVATHTGATLEICERLAGHLSLRSPSKVRRVSELVDQAVNFEALLRKLRAE